MSSPDIYWCEPCIRNEGNTRAESYCNDCNEPLCDICSKHHRKRPRTKNHKIVPISKAGKLRPTVFIPDTCPNHEEEPFALFCLGHDKLCCSICYQESHICCLNVVSIEKASREVNIETMVEGIDKDLSDLRYFFSDFILKQNSNIEELLFQKSKIKDKITIIRQDINSYLDDLELAVEDNLTKTHLHCQNELEGKIRDLKKRNEKMESWQNAVSYFSDKKIDAKSFVSLKVIQQFQQDQEKFLTEFEEDMLSYGLKFDDDNPVEKVTNNLTKLGSVEILSNKNLSSTKSRCGKNTNETDAIRKPILTCSIDTAALGSINSIEDGCLAPENRVVLASHPYLYIYNVQNRTVERVGIENGSGDLTCDFQNHVYVSYPGVGIDKVNINHFKVVKRIYGDHDPGDESYCIRVRNDTIYTTEYYNVVLLSLDGQVKKRIETEMEAVLLCVNSKGEIYASDRKRILHITEAESQKIVYTNQVDGNQIVGMGVDKQDRLIICNCVKKLGTVIRKDTSSGTEEILLDELKSPSVIATYPSVNKLLVLTDKGKACNVYQM